MSRANWAKLTLLASAASGCLLGGFVAEVASKEPAKVNGSGVLFPPDHSVLLSGEFEVICKTQPDKLEVEGELLAWEPFEPLGVAHVSVYPGHNKIRIGTETIEVFVARNTGQPGGPQGWTICRSHPIEGHGEKRCADCHETKRNDGRIHVLGLKSYKACFECHQSVEFELIHSHPLEPIEHCQMCHAMHGSKRKALLKAPVKKLCADCHDS